MTLQEAFNIAAQRQQAGQLAEAEAIYRQILGQEPNHADALHHLGILAWHTGRRDAAVDFLFRSIAAKPDSAEFKIDLGHALMEQGRIEQAIAVLREVTARHPGHAEAWSRLGESLHKTGRFAEAAAALRRAVELSPNSARGMNNLAVALQEQGRAAEAIEIYRQTLAREPNLTAAWLNMANALYELRQFDQAIAANEQAIKLEPGLVEAHNSLGNAYQETGQFPQAIAAYRQAIATKPDFRHAHTNLGIALQRRGDHVAAAEAFVQSLRLKPDDPDAYWNMAAAWRTNRQVSVQVEATDKLPKLPYLGDKVVLLRCPRAARERLRAAGLHGGYLINPNDGADHWLSAQLTMNHDRQKLGAMLGQWVEWIRNEAAMRGEICTVWLPTMPEAFAQAFRHAAGEDLVEISGDSAEAIHAQLAARAVAPPVTDGKIFAVVSIRNGGLELLPHWLEHYTRLGVDQILVGVFDDVSGPSAEEMERCAGKWKFHRFAQHWGVVSEAEHYSQRQTGCRQAGALPGTWIMHTDLDELHEYPAPIHQIIAAAREKQINAIYGRLVDRVAADGSMPPVQAEPPLWQQFPVECDLTRRITKGMTRKVMMARFSVLVNAGHHDALNEPPGAVPIGTEQDYRVAHFKWHGDVINRMRWGLQRPNAHPCWKRETRGLLAWLDSRGGRIDLSEPGLRTED
jgi:tetratricopeptide (TPR) repeat protein